MPLAMYYAILAISLLFIVSIYLAGAVLLLGLSWFFLERSFGPGRIPALARVQPAYYRDALCVAIFGSAAVMGLNRLPALFARWPLLRHTLDSAVPQGLDLLNPAAGTIAAAIAGSFLLAGMVGLAAGLVAAYVRPIWMRLSIMIFYAVLMATNVATPGAFIRDAAFHLFVISVLWLGVKRIVRFNVMGYFLLAAMVALVPGAIELIEQPSPFFHANGYAVVAFAVVILAWPLMCWQRRAASV
jgi:hypothetical protein